MTEKNDPLSTGAGLGVFGSLAAGQADSLVGRQLGDYRIEALIAEGGMGRVYRACRADGSFERDVAVKISAGASLDEELRLRFVQEQQVLAGLNHPNICQLFDARVTEEGWPFIVMEFVDGQSIVEFCETNQLDTRKRVKLLLDVVDAVAYAHSQLVVHRDIKPANVLVNEQGQVKLLDFGIAKLLESDANLTQRAPMTPRYASPEQLLGQPITVASDIAQLGLLLYEVLTGKPLNPSETLPSAIQRTADGLSLRVDSNSGRGIPREVVPIIEQCLKADPQDRYRDSNSLRADLEAYLGGYPVAAVGQSTGYRLRKLVQRNIPTTVTIAVALLAIVAGVSWYTWQLALAQEEAEQQAASARIEAERANQVSQFLITLFDAPDPQYARGADVSVREVLESGIEKVRTELDGQESLKADLLMTLGRVFNELGEFDKGGELVKEAADIHSGIETDDSTRYAVAVFTYGQNIMYQGDLEHAVTKFEEAVRIARRTTTEKSRELQGGMLNSLGIALSRLNRFEESESVYEESIRLKTEVFGADHLETSVPIANYARLLTKLGNYEEALPMLESSYEIAARELGPYHPWIAPRAINLGRAYEAMGRADEAEELLRVALEQDRHIYGEEHHYVASSLQNLGILIYRHKDQDEGIELIEQGLQIEEESLGADHIDTNQTRTLLAGFYIETGRLKEAASLLEAARAPLTAAFDNDHRYLADFRTANGHWYLASNRVEEAIEELQASISMNERLFGSDSDRLPEPLFYLADAYAAAGDGRGAVDAHKRALGLLEVAGKAESKHYERLAELQDSVAAAPATEPGNPTEQQLP